MARQKGSSCASRGGAARRRVDGRPLCGFSLYPARAGYVVDGPRTPV